MSLLKRAGLVAATVAGLTLAIAGPAAAHVSVNPDTAAPGGYTKLTFRVPTESDTASTTAVEINFPQNAPVASVSLKPQPGWTAVATTAKLATPLEAHGAQITEAVSKVTWTAQNGGGIKPGEFQEFDVSLGPLPETNQMVFKALQTYSDGTIVRWIDEPTTDGTEPESPAPVLKLAAAPAAGPDAAAPTAPDAAEESSDGGSNGLGIAGLIAGVLALLVAVAAFVRSGRTPATATASAAPAKAEPTKAEPAPKSEPATKSGPAPKSE